MSGIDPGKLVGGKYRLKLRLGAGGMGEVWSATNQFTERQVAIKLLSPAIADKEPDAKQRFLNEAKVSARIDHPNIVDVIDVGQAEDGQLFLVMELLTGVSLETALRRQVPPMTQRELAIVMLDVAGALEAAHAAGVVHRDLKPSNVFLHKSKDRVIPTVLDFGVSKFLWRKDDEETHAITIAGTVLGSPLYMSPEQARGETELDGRTDIFAFGGILFEALTGARAYEAANFNALIVKIATGRPKDIDEHAATTPESLRNVVKSCLEPDLRRRAQNFADVIYLIRAALPDLGINPQRIPTAQTPAALIDADATNALPVFAPPLSSKLLIAPPPQLPHIPLPPQTERMERTAYESALPVREAPPPSSASPWVVLIVAGCIVIALGIASLAREAPTFVTTPPPAPTSGSLAIAADPKCSLTVDDKEHGLTPVTIELPPGDHKVACRPPSGEPRSTIITVRAGSLSRYRFVF